MGGIFFYLNDKTQDRLRLTIGAEVKVLKNMNAEIYYLHQFPQGAIVQPVHAIGLILDLYFKTKCYNYK